VKDFRDSGHGTKDTVGEGRVKGPVSENKKNKKDLRKVQRFLRLAKKKRKSVYLLD